MLHSAITTNLKQKENTLFESMEKGQIQTQCLVFPSELSEKITFQEYLSAMEKYWNCEVSLLSSIQISERTFLHLDTFLPKYLYLGNQDLFYLADHLPALQHLTFTNCCHINDMGLQAIAKNCRRLKTLEILLSSIWQITAFISKSSFWKWRTESQMQAYLTFQSISS